MAKRKRHDRSVQDSDYDGAWKEFGGQTCRAIVEADFPRIAASIDWGYPPQWMDLPVQ